MTRILLISGSLARPAHTAALIEDIAHRLESKGCKTDVWDLRERPLPFADPVYHHEPEAYPDKAAQALIQLAKQADAFVIGSPNYHNSYSGVLKNALDILDMNMFRDKPVGLVGNGGGIRSTQPIDHLRIVVRGLLGVAIPTQVASCKSDYSREGDQYKVAAEDLKKRLDVFTDQLITYTVKLKSN
ncbi:NAD(P)H-dependent oxidoreductase [Brevibacillus ruminantium]|uniref:NAD(P)H-dependent oxidoreductase n=1 Tax=Brevibacillus ruminantium TaxID=2950604 RepID=A0ABY4WGB9_9BACL|nr:NADPH-dependent FMN reductase [Brevibacillus ruminantium]USG66177.1 NAD(P)H-dependent oxidoreductase [Brevibacillus ruminantium]